MNQNFDTPPCPYYITSQLLLYSIVVAPHSVLLSVGFIVIILNDSYWGNFSFVESIYFDIRHMRFVDAPCYV